jgi:hypothetical protein
MKAVALFDLSVANTQPYLTYPRRGAAPPRRNGGVTFGGYNAHPVSERRS